MCGACMPEVRDHNIPAILQGMHPPTWVSLQTGVNVRHHDLLLILVQSSLHVKPPQGIHHIHIWICGLKTWHVQMCRSEVFLIPTPPPVTSTTGCFTHSGVSIRICTSSIWRGRGRVFRTLLCQLGLGRPSSWVTCRHPCSLSTPHVF